MAKKKKPVVKVGTPYETETATLDPIYSGGPRTTRGGGYDSPARSVSVDPFAASMGQEKQYNTDAPVDPFLEAVYKMIEAKEANRVRVKVGRPVIQEGELSNAGSAEPLPGPYEEPTFYNRAGPPYMTDQYKRQVGQDYLAGRPTPEKQGPWLDENGRPLRLSDVKDWPYQF